VQHRAPASDDGAWALLDTLAGAAALWKCLPRLAADTPPLRSGHSRLLKDAWVPPSRALPFALARNLYPSLLEIGMFAPGKNPSTMGELPSLLPPLSAATSEGIYYSRSLRRDRRVD